ncbi:hypothetical protein ACQCVP_07025, partial [Rossellomorea vietnamensis]|uniref:hypothetical protein n=1 Tax=Rossellomorea vietnamensis TaxID=218284 RepID=UPI003CF4B43F
MSDSHFPEFVDSQSMKTLEVAFYFGSIIFVGVLTQFEHKKCTKSSSLLYLSCRETSIDWRFVHNEF